jgi:glutamate-1-semialdehyde 2,1-aminomutase
LATLQVIAQTDAIERANRAAGQLRDRLNDAIREVGSPWLAYGEFSGFHFFTNPAKRNASVADLYAGRVPMDELKGGTPPSVIHQLRCGLAVSGADIFPWPGGVVSAVHSEEDIEITARAFKHCLESMAQSEKGA